MGFSLKAIGRRITDIFDANTQADQQKRLAAGQPRYYQQQQPQGNVVQRNFVRPIVDNAKGMAQIPGSVYNSAAGRVARTAVNLPALGVGNLTGNQGVADFARRSIDSNLAAIPGELDKGAQNFIESAKQGTVMGETIGVGGPKLTPGETPKLTPTDAASSLTGSKPKVTAKKVTATDKAIQKRLNERPENLKTIEQSKTNMADSQRLELAKGDTGQAGLQMDPKARDALLKKTQAEAKAAAKPQVRLKNSELPKDNPLYISPKQEAALNANVAETAKYKGDPLPINKPTVKAKGAPEGVGTIPLEQLGPPKIADPRAVTGKVMKDPTVQKVFDNLSKADRLSRTEQGLTATAIEQAAKKHKVNTADLGVWDRLQTGKPQNVAERRFFKDVKAETDRIFKIQQQVDPTIAYRENYLPGKYAQQGTPPLRDFSVNDTQQFNTTARLKELTENSKKFDPKSPEFKANKLEIEKSLRNLEELNKEASLQADDVYEATRPKVNPDELEVRKAAQQARAAGDVETATMLEESLTPQVKAPVDAPEVPQQAAPVGTDAQGRAYDANGEYIDAPQTIVVDRTIPRTERLKAAATPEDLEAFRGDVKSEVSEAFEGVDNLNVQKEVYAFSRGDITADQLSPETVVTMEKLKAITDDLTPEKLRTKEMYLPEMSSKYAPPPNDGTVFSEFDKNFSTSKKRNNLLDADELLDPEQAMHHYVDQMVYQQKADLIESARYQNYKAPEKYVAGKRAVVQDLAKSMDKEFAKESGKSVVRLQKDTSKNVGERLHKNFKETGDPSEMLGTVKDPMPTASLFRTNREALKGVEISPQIGSLYDITIARHERAQGMANDIFARANQSDDFFGTVKAQYDDLYENGLLATDNSRGVPPMKDIMSKEQYDFIVTNHTRQAESLGSPTPLASLERKLNAETAIYFRERLDFQDPRVDRAFNDELSYLIKDGNRVRSLAEKAINEVASMIHVGLLGLKPRSAALNLTELARVYADVTGPDGVKTLQKSIAGARPKTVQKKLAEYGVSDDLISDATEDLIKVKRSEGNIALKGYRKVQQGAMLPFQTTENFKDFTLLTALEQKYKTITDPAQKRLAILDDFNRKAYKYGHGGSIRIVQKSKLARLAGQFGQYTMKDLGYMGERMGKGDYGFVAKTLGLKAVVAVPMYYAFGAIVAQTLGLNDYRGGPLISVIDEMFTQMGYENDRIEKEGGEFNWDNVRNEVAKKSAGMVMPAGDMLLNKVGVQELTNQTKDLPFLRDDNTISDNRRGYNAGKDGRARFAVGGEEEKIWDTVTRWLNGTYNGSEAREYFGNSPLDLELYGKEIYKPNKDNRQVPVDSRWQEKVEAASGAKDGQEIRRVIESSHEYQGLKKTAFENDPTTKADYEAIMKAEYNKETGKRENDVLKPEKWSRINNNPKLFDLLKARTLFQQQEFGGEIDPIYGLTDPDQVKRVMTIRAQNTGDQIEEEEILRATTDWYTPFEKKEVEYGASFGDSEMNSDFGNSARKQAWIDSYVEQPPQVKEYFQLKETDPDRAKALFNTTNLSDVFAQYKSDRLKSINIKRELEGVPPIDEEVFGNVTFGYEHDEDKVARELYFKGKGGYGGYSRRAGSGGGGGKDSVGSLHKYDVKLSAGNGIAKPKVTVRKGSKITARKTAKPKVAIKRSAV